MGWLKSGAVRSEIARSHRAATRATWTILAGLAIAPAPRSDPDAGWRRRTRVQASSGLRRCLERRSGWQSSHCRSGWADGTAGRRVRRVTGHDMHRALQKPSFSVRILLVTSHSGPRKNPVCRLGSIAHLCQCPPSGAPPGVDLDRHDATRDVLPRWKRGSRVCIGGSSVLRFLSRCDWPASKTDATRAGRRVARMACIPGACSAPRGRTPKNGRAPSQLAGRRLTLRRPRPHPFPDRIAMIAAQASRAIARAVLASIVWCPVM